jgi:hypothetical protein
MSSKPEWICMVCKGPLGYEPPMCCSDTSGMCGCRGLPTVHPICSKECYKKWEEGTPQEKQEWLSNVGIK